MQEITRRKIIVTVGFLTVLCFAISLAVYKSLDFQRVEDVSQGAEKTDNELFRIPTIQWDSLIDFKNWDIIDPEKVGNMSKARWELKKQKRGKARVILSVVAIVVFFAFLGLLLARFLRDNKL